MINLLFALLVATPSHAEIVEKTVAIVNSELVLESDFKDLVKRIPKQGMVDESLLFDKPATSLIGNRKAQLDYLINEKILQSEIKRLNLAVTNDRVESELKEMARKNQVSEAELAKVIQQQGVSMDDYRRFLKDSIEKRSLMDAEIISKLRISDEDALNEYLKTNPNNRPSIDEFSVSHIFFNPKKGGAEASIKRAETVLGKLRSGENFENLAQQFSEDPNFSTGGALGTFKSGEFLPEIEEAISSLKVNETTPIVKSRMGFHIVKLTGKKLTTDPKFERAKDKIKAQLLENSFKRQLKNWLQTKRDESFIRINE
ncbi:peptidylprolyl isomerase [Bdellovibrio bacteriovorus]|uniref:peptidylprolyl isomerase n=1 Tax=Bdellovibrio bacteriovorus TaxID=959 RepID=UPI0003026D8D|nr:peptidylprolyl isomerase [Bdellovibrio bacteriovorus]AHZ85677.1 survival protein SurA [Bdellovibrio bacteriovorus]BEV66596.1 Chaperone SurA [Bdellovibrio bacteriovorus]